VLNLRFFLRTTIINWWKAIFLLLICSVLLLERGSAQNYNLNFIFSVEPSSGTPKFQQNFKNYDQLYAEAGRVILELKTQGYLTCATDSIVEKDKDVLFYLHLGENYKWVKLTAGNVPEGVLSLAGYRDKFFTNTPFSLSQFEKVSKNILAFYENSGYPFAQISLDSISIKDGEVKGSLRLKRNTLYKIDSVIVKGDDPVGKRYLLNYLGIKEGMPYNEQVVKNIGRRLSELPFIKQIRPYEVFFSQSQTKIYLYLERQQASNFNGVVGFLPNEEGEVTITGDVTLRLQNALKRGELIGLAWRRLQTETQELKLEFNYPFVLNSPIGTDFDFRLFRRDSSFIELDTRVGLRYIFKQNDYFSIFFRSHNSSVLRERITLADATADYSSQTFGIAFQKEKLDYRFNPTRGHFFYLSAGFGGKRINRNPRVDDSFYDDIVMNTDQYTGEVISNLFLPLFKRATLRFGFQGAFIENDQIFINEMYRIGGVYSLRGADEQSIFASLYGIGTLEFRYLLERNSYFLLFFDQAYYENRNPNNPINDSPLGFGGGINFETKAGIFSIIYALGKQFDNPVDLRAGKIHFGFSSLF
jgi:translocation and assembly module TamA